MMAMRQAVMTMSIFAIGIPVAEEASVILMRAQLKAASALIHLPAMRALIAHGQQILGARAMMDSARADFSVQDSHNLYANRHRAAHGSRWSAAAFVILSALAAGNTTRALV